MPLADPHSGRPDDEYLTEPVIAGRPMGERDTPAQPGLERAKGFEPSTPTLARLCSTPELRPRSGGGPRRVCTGLQACETVDAYLVWRHGLPKGRRAGLRPLTATTSNQGAGLRHARRIVRLWTRSSDSRANHPTGQPRPPASSTRIRPPSFVKSSRASRTHSRLGRFLGDLVRGLQATDPDAGTGRRGSRRPGQAGQGRRRQEPCPGEQLARMGLPMQSIPTVAAFWARADRRPVSKARCRKARSNGLSSSF